MTNLNRIKKGDTYVWELVLWQDRDKSVLLDITGHSFAFTAVNTSTGATVISLTNADFVQQAAANHRKLTLSDTVTDDYPVGELRYQLDVTSPSGVVETWMEGFVNVIP